MQQHLWLTLAVAVMFYGSSTAFAQSAKQTIEASCQTEATSGTGERKTCNSAWQQLDAPDGYVINDRAIERSENFNGSQNWCDEEFLEPTEVVAGSGLAYPRKFRLRAHAYSHRGAFGGAGHSHCYRTVTFVKYK